MDGENNGKPYFLMDDLGGKVPLFSETSIYIWFDQVVFYEEQVLLECDQHLNQKQIGHSSTVKTTLVFPKCIPIVLIQKNPMWPFRSFQQRRMLRYFLSSARRLFWTPAVQETHGFFEKSTVYANII